MTKFYSQSTSGFYSIEINGDDIPSDAVQITDEYWQALLEGQSTGQIITADKKGYPILTDRAPPTHEELVSAANYKKAALKAAADSEIDWRQDAVDGGYAEANEVTELAAWKKYRVLLMRVDTSKTPDLDWPKAPQ